MLKLFSLSNQLIYLTLASKFLFWMTDWGALLFPYDLGRS